MTAQHLSSPCLWHIVSHKRFNTKVRVSRDHKTIWTEEEQPVGYRKLQASTVRKAA